MIQEGVPVQMFFPSKSVGADLAIENAVGGNVVTMVFEMSFNLNLKSEQSFFHTIILLLLLLRNAAKWHVLLSRCSRSFSSMVPLDFFVF